MDGLSDIGGMKIVVIRYALRVMVFQRGQKVQQRQWSYLKCFEKISSLQREEKKSKSKQIGCQRRFTWKMVYVVTVRGLS